MKPLITAALTRAATIATTYLERAPSDAAFPYFVVQAQDSGGAAYSAGTDDIQEERTLAFNGYGTNAAALLDLIAALESSLERTALTLTAGNIMATRIGASGLSQDPDRDDDGEIVWHAVLLVNFDLQRSL